MIFFYSHQTHFLGPAGHKQENGVEIAVVRWCHHSRHNATRAQLGDGRLQPTPLPRVRRRPGASRKFSTADPNAFIEHSNAPQQLAEPAFQRGVVGCHSPTQDGSNWHTRSPSSSALRSVLVCSRRSQGSPTLQRSTLAWRLRSSRA